MRWNRESGALDRIVCIRSEQKPPGGWSSAVSRIACDVSNPLLGEQGAVWVYGPQKGVREEEKSIFRSKDAPISRKKIVGVHRTGRKGRAGAPGRRAAWDLPS